MTTPNSNATSDYYAQELKKFLERIKSEEDKKRLENPVTNQEFLFETSISHLHKQLKNLRLIAFPGENDESEAFEDESMEDSTCDLAPERLDLSGHSLEECEEQRIEEEFVLRSIFDQDLTISTSQPTRYTVDINREDPRKMFATFTLPVKYPYAPLQISVNCESLGTLSSHQHSTLMKILREQIQSNLGSPQIFALVDTIQNWMETNAPKQSKKGYQPVNMLKKMMGRGDYESRNQSEVLSLQQLLIDQSCQSFDLSPHYTRAVLSHFKWDIEKAVQTFLEAKKNSEGKNLEDFFKECNVHVVTRELNKVTDAEEEHECLVCMDDVKIDGGCRLNCNHFFCNDCWSSYLNIQMSEGQTLVRCPGHQCKNIVDRAVLSSFVDHKKYSKFVDFSLRSFVEQDPHMSWCTTKGCEMVMEIHSNNITVKCHCDKMNCTECGRNYHWPATCTHAKWSEEKNKRNFSVEESFSEAFLLKYTKDCTNRACGVPIEKNGGCNHMVCRKCSTEFCWICLGNWSPIHYRCTTEVVAETVDDYRYVSLNYTFPQIRVVHQNFQIEEQERIMIAAEKISRISHSCTHAMFNNWEVISQAYELIFLARMTIFNICTIGEFIAQTEAGKREVDVAKNQKKLKSAVETIQRRIQLLQPLTDRLLCDLDSKAIDAASNALIESVHQVQYRVNKVLQYYKQN